MTITNTKTQDPAIMLLVALAEGSASAAIEQAEANGQRELVAGSQLPKDGLKEVAKALSIKVIGPSEGDDLFCDVKMPQSYTLKATEHAMHSDLLDENGVRLARIFYKAAPYDRVAWISLVPEEGQS